MKISAKTATATAIAAVGIVLTAAGCGKGGGEQKPGEKSGAAAVPGAPAAAEATPVVVAQAERKPVQRTISVSGSVAAIQSIDLSPKISAKVVRVVGREGTIVRRGQIVVQQDTSDLVTQQQQAQANVESARARLSQAQTQFNLQTTTSRTAIQDAQAQLASARAQLALAKRPQRSQEVAVAENAVAQAQANYDRASADVKRYQGLVKEGASAQSVLDQYVTQEQVARAALDTARQQLEIARTGGRSESINQAQAAVSRAEIGVRTARANTQQNQVRRDEIEAAQAALAQSQAALAFARQQVENAAIRSPINGVVSARLTEPGQQAAPGQAVLRLVALGTLFFEAQVPETDLRSVRAGLPVSVSIDAFPRQKFSGKIERILPTANTTSRNVTVRIVLPNQDGRLRPGLYARGNIVAESRVATVIPKDAVVVRDGKPAVFVVASGGGKAEMRRVQTGIQTTETTEVRTGIEPGDRVIVTGQDALEDGAPVQVRDGQATRVSAKNE